LTEKKKAGRPKKEINWELFESLCSIQCTQAEIANVMKIDAETLRDRARIKYEQQDFSLIYKQFSDCGKSSLRRFQYSLAKKNAAMAIWLGKQWLGQKEDPASDIAPESMEKFNNLMSQLISLQSKRMEADKIHNNDTKS
jgi:hypothetical protein